MIELGITQYRLAKRIGVPPILINDIVHCRRSITADMALRIGKALGMTPDFWLNLQRMYDLDVARAKTDVSDIQPLCRRCGLRPIGPRSTSSERDARSVGAAIDGGTALHVGR